MIVVTHEIGFAREAADNVVFMDEGRIVESGRPADLLSAPKHERTRAFLGCTSGGAAPAAGAPAAPAAVLDAWADRPVRGGRGDAGPDSAGRAADLLPIVCAQNGVENERLALRRFSGNTPPPSRRCQPAGCG